MRKCTHNNQKALLVFRCHEGQPECRVVGVTGMIEPKIGRKIVKKLIIKWDPEVDLGCLVYES